MVKELAGSFGDVAGNSGAAEGQKQEFAVVREGVEANGTGCGGCPVLVWCEGRVWAWGVWVVHGLEAPGMSLLVGVAWVSRVEGLVSFERGPGRVECCRVPEGVGCRDTVQVGCQDVDSAPFGVASRESTSRRASCFCFSSTNAAAAKTTTAAILAASSTTTFRIWKRTIYADAINTSQSSTGSACQ